MTSTPRRPRGRRPAQEPPATGSAAVDAEPDAETVARTIALQQLAAAPRTRRQLADAMARRGVPDDVAERVLDRFEEVRLVDDAEYAAMWVRSRHGARGLARRALAHELRQRGVDGEDADEALDQLDDEQEAATARALVDRRLSATRRLDRDARVRRLAGMLARKGYPASLAFRVIREALEAEGADLAGLEEPAE
ncbi:MAG: regulatory protein RecX [Actinomycetota bacterium]